jgi:hypothetical protein
MSLKSNKRKLTTKTFLTKPLLFFIFFDQSFNPSLFSLPNLDKINKRKKKIQTNWWYADQIWKYNKTQIANSSIANFLLYVISHIPPNVSGVRGTGLDSPAAAVCAL